jgi:dTDP-4-dehydrorhamnose reductase
MRILIAGVDGRLGRALRGVLAGHEVSGFDISTVDLTDFEATRLAVQAAKPDLVIHVAAWTDVDGCARDPEKAIRINGFGAQHAALAAAEVGAAILYVSTNEVFDGRRDRPYYEYDPTSPANPYGYSKWVGEQAVMHVNPRHFIVRTAWLFARGGKNFIQSILKAAQDGKVLRVVANEVANPTSNDDLAEAIARLIETPRYGIYHLVNEGHCSRYQFARYALDKAGFAETPVEKISSFEWSRPSVPPPYCPLANLAGAQIGIRLRPWQEAVDAFLTAESLTP